MNDELPCNSRDLAKWTIAEFEAIDPEIHAEYRVDVGIAVQLARAVLELSEEVERLREALLHELEGEHIFRGACPEPGEAGNRDPDCPQCQRLTAALAEADGEGDTHKTNFAETCPLGGGHERMEKLSATICSKCSVVLHNHAPIKVPAKICTDE